MEIEILGLPMMYYIAMVAKVLVAFVFVLLTVAYATYAERKIIGHMQVRLGPMRTGWHGLLQPIADGVKLFFKEEIIPSQASTFAFLIAPLIALVPAFITFAVIPFGGVIEVAGYKIPLQIAAYYDTTAGQVFDINVGVLYILAMSSLGVYGIVLAGWASNSKYSLMGGLRASAQMISYELSAGLSIVCSVHAFRHPFTEQDCRTCSPVSAVLTGIFSNSLLPPSCSSSVLLPRSTVLPLTCLRLKQNWYPVSVPNIQL